MPEAIQEATQEVPIAGTESEAEAQTEDNTQLQPEPGSEEAVNQLLEQAGIEAEEAKAEVQAEADPKVEEQPAEEKYTIDDKVVSKQVAKKFRRLNHQLAEFEREKAEFKSKLELLESDPVRFLQENGITISDWAKKQVETPEMKAMREIDKLRNELKEKELKEQKKRLEEDDQQYQRQLSSAIEQEFTKMSEDYSILNALLTEGVFSKEDFFPFIGSEVQMQFDEYGRKPDLGVVFKRYEDAFSKLADVLTRKKAGSRPAPKAAIPQPVRKPAPAQTLSNRQVEVSNTAAEPTSREEIEAMVKRQFGIG